MFCSECEKTFKEKFEGQTLCGKCYYELHPEKDYTRASKERLWGALGMMPPRSARSFAGFSPEEKGKGISDDEIAEATLPASNKAGIVPNRLKVGDKLPDGSVLIGKQATEGHKL